MDFCSYTQKLGYYQRFDFFMMSRKYQKMTQLMQYPFRMCKVKIYMGIPQSLWQKWQECHFCGLTKPSRLNRVSEGGHYRYLGSEVLRGSREEARTRTAQEDIGKASWGGRGWEGPWKPFPSFLRPSKPNLTDEYTAKLLVWCISKTNILLWMLPYPLTWCHYYDRTSIIHSGARLSTTITPSYTY